mgnify:CR=1 FL=1
MKILFQYEWVLFSIIISWGSMTIPLRITMKNEDGQSKISWVPQLHQSDYLNCFLPSLLRNQSSWVSIVQLGTNYRVQNMISFVVEWLLCFQIEILTLYQWHGIIEKLHKSQNMILHSRQLLKFDFYQVQQINQRIDKLLIHHQLKILFWRVYP